MNVSASQRTAPAPLSRAARVGLSTIAPKLNVSLAEIARKAGLSKALVETLARYGHWPKRVDRQVLGQAIRELLAQRGATPQQLAVLFEPCASRTHAGSAMQGVDLRRRSKRNPFTASQAGDEPSEVDVLIAKQVMTPGTARHFKLFRNPFDGPVERDEQFFQSPEIAYVREAVWQCAKGASFMALIGESGAGKTTILADLGERLNREGRGIVLIQPSTLGMEETDRGGHVLRSTDLLHAVITTLDSSAKVPMSLQSRTVLATRLLMASAKAGNAHLLAVEEAHGMPEATLRHMKRLHELREGRRSLLGILLVAQPELKRRLIDGLRIGTLREVAQRCEIVEMAPLGPELQSYLECRAKACGRSLDSMVEPAAIPVIAEKLSAKVRQRPVSMSYPLAANNVVTRAMNIAAEIGVPIVNADVVRAI